MGIDSDYYSYIEVLYDYNFDKLSAGRKFFDSKEDFLKISDMLALNFPLSFVKSIVEGEGFEDKKLVEYDTAKRALDKSKILSAEVDIIQPYIKNFQKLSDKGASMFFFGINSVGKTHTGLHIMHEIYKRHRAPSGAPYKMYYIRQHNLYESYLEKYDKDGSDDFYRLVSDVDLLFVDEIGKETSVTDSLRVFLEDLIRKRSSKLLPTIMCGNIRPDAIANDSQKKSASLSSRLERAGDNNAPENQTTILNKYGESIYEAMRETFRFFAFTKTNKNMRDKAWSFDE